MGAAPMGVQMPCKVREVAMAIVRLVDKRTGKEILWGYD